MIYGAVFLLAVVVSLDGLMAGVAYGAKAIIVPRRARLIISLSSALTMLFSMLLGTFLTGFIAEVYAERIGAMLLIVLGLMLILRTRVQAAAQDKENVEVELAEWRVRPLGVVIRILRDPEAADADHSGSISQDEAVFLGVALALDAFGAGLGAGLVGMPVLPLVIAVGITKFCFISMGVKWGERMSLLCPRLQNSYIPGLVLIALGVFNML